MNAGRGFRHGSTLTLSRRLPRVNRPTLAPRPAVFHPDGPEARPPLAGRARGAPRASASRGRPLGARRQTGDDGVMSPGDAPPILRAIRRLLDREGVTWREVEHGPAPTCEDAARERGEPLALGGKCLFLKAGDTFGLFALSAAHPLDSRALRRSLGERRLRFASAQELLRATGLVPGSVPPFGEPVLPFPLHADESLARGDRIAFNAGSLRHSIILATRDWLRVARPRILAYAGPPEKASS